MSPRHKFQHHTYGLTIVELLIASTIGIMILTITANLTTNIFKTRAQLQQLNELQQSTTAITQDLRDSIRWSSSLPVISNTTITGDTLTVNGNTYIFTGSGITKNGNLLHNSNIQIARIGSNPIFSIANSSSSTNLSDAYLPAVRIQINVTSTTNSSLNLTPDVIFTNRRQQYGP